MDFFIITGALLGTVSYIAAFGVFHERADKVIAVAISNGSFAFCFGILCCRAVSTHLAVPQDDALSLAVSFMLAMTAPWVIHNFSGVLGKKLISALKWSTFRKWLLNLLDPSKK